MLEQLEDVILRSLLAKDPVAKLKELSAELSESDRAHLAHIDPDGFRMAGLMVWKLRFERLLRGSNDLTASFDKNPKEFSALFRRYHLRIEPTAYFPVEEVALFKQWLNTLPE
jgi:hypothetical protein